MSEELNALNEIDGGSIVATISTKAPKATEKGEGWSIELTHNFPGDIDSAIEIFGGPTVLNLLFAQYKIGFQAAVRRLAEAGKSDEEITETMAQWKPGMRLGLGGDPIQRTLANFGNLSPEQQAEIMAKLAAMQKG